MTESQDKSGMWAAARAQAIDRATREGVRMFLWFIATEPRTGRRDVFYVRSGDEGRPYPNATLLGSYPPGVTA